MRAVARLAAELGSDVPFFLRGGAAVLRGRGELLEPLPPCAGQWLVLAVPAHAVPNKTATPVSRAGARRFLVRRRHRACRRPTRGGAPLGGHRTCAMRSNARRASSSPASTTAGARLEDACGRRSTSRARARRCSRWRQTEVGRRRSASGASNMVSSPTPFGRCATREHRLGSTTVPPSGTLRATCASTGARSSNGRTADFGSVNPGSSPGRAASCSLRELFSHDTS